MQVIPLPAKPLQCAKREAWILNPTLLNHVAGNLAWFHSFKPNKNRDGKFICINEAKEQNIAAGTGTVKVSAKISNDKYDEIELKDVEYIPGSYNFVSEQALMKQEFTKTKTTQFTQFTRTKGKKREVLKTMTIGDVYKMEFIPPSKSLNDITRFVQPSDACDLWHLRLIHSLQNMVEAKNKYFDDMTGIQDHETNSCEPCNNGQNRFWQIPNQDPTDNIYSHLGEDIIVNIVKAEVQSIKKQKYVVIVVDRKSLCVWARPIIEKGNFLQHIQLFRSTLLDQTKHVVTKLTFDTCSHLDQYDSAMFVSWCTQHNIVLDNSNTTIETKHYDKMRKVTAQAVNILKSVSLPTVLWCQVLDTVVFLENSFVGHYNSDNDLEFWTQSLHAKDLRIIASPSWAIKEGCNSTVPVDCYILRYSNREKRGVFYDANNKQCFKSVQFVCFEEGHIFRTSVKAPEMNVVQSVS